MKRKNPCKVLCHYGDAYVSIDIAAINVILNKIT